jgi:hypothetical protein
MFLHQPPLDGGVTFGVKVPRYNETTRAALYEMEESKGKVLCGKDIQATLADLKRDDKANA